MRILIVGNSIHTGTGYGTQIKTLCRIFQSIGHDVAVLSTFGVHGGTLNIEGVQHYTTYRTNWGEDVLKDTVAHFKADVVFTLHDIWVYNCNPQEIAGIPHVAYFPVDSVPAAPATVRQAKLARYPVTYSQFGHEQMSFAGVRTTMIPHAIDTDVFSPGDKAEARKELGLPADAFICAMVGANKGYPSRKAFPEQLMAFAEFRKTHPDAILLIHSQKSPVGHWADGIHFDPLIKNLGLNDAIYWTNEFAASQGLFTGKDVANVYRASDVLLHASMAEGFGLCVAEAQACGTPVITTNFSSMPELTVNGVTIKEYQKTWSLLGCWQVLPSVHHISHGALEHFYTRSGGPHEREDAAKGVDFIRSTYSIPVITEQWKAFLEKVEAEVTEIKSLSAVGD